MSKMVAVLFHVLLLMMMIPASADGANIGNTIYLPESDLGRPFSPRRNNIFEVDFSRFLRNESLHHTYNTQRFQSTSDSVFNELGITFSLSVPIKELQLSFDSTFQAISGRERNISSALILVESYSKRQFLQYEARSLQQILLRSDFLQELRNLPEPPTRIEAATQWASYRDFLIRWGSHYVSGISYGSWLRTWSTAASTKHYTQRQITAKGCADLTGISHIPTIHGCAGIDLSEMTTASQLDMNVQIEVRGGEASTRAQLTVHRTDQLLRDFIEQGQKNDNDAVKYDLTPIWRLVLARYHSNNTKEWRVATALEGYYNGFLAFSCPYITMPDPFTVLQLFRRTPTAGTYQCVRQCQGCRRNDDCHLKIDGCYCYGRSCIAALGADGRYSIQTSRDQLPRDQSPNVNCYFSFPTCDCGLTSKELNCGSDNLIPIWEQTK